MTESVLDVDSVIDVGTPDSDAAGTAASSTDNEVSLFPDATSDAAPGDVNGHSAPASEVPDNVDLLRTPVDKLPANLQPLAPLAKNLQAEFTRTQQDLREREAQLTQRESQILEQNKQAQSHQQQWADRVQQSVYPQTDPVQEMRQSLTEDENRAVDTVQAIVQHQVGSELETMRGELDALRQENLKLRSGYSGVHNYVTEQVQHRTRGAVAEAISKHGEDVRNYGPQIIHMLKGDAPPNPLTGKRYTVTQAYEQITGKTAQRAAGLRQADKRARRTSKRAVAANASVDTSEDAGPLSEAEVLNQMQALGFE